MDNVYQISEGYVKVNVRPRFTIKHHLLRYVHPSSLRRTTMYASLLGISQALHLVPAGESGNLKAHTA